MYVLIYDVCFFTKGTTKKAHTVYPSIMLRVKRRLIPVGDVTTHGIISLCISVITQLDFFSFFERYARLKWSKGMGAKSLSVDVK